MTFSLCNEEAINLLCNEINNCIQYRITKLKYFEEMNKTEKEQKIIKIKKEAEIYYKYYKRVVESGIFKEDDNSIKEIVLYDYNNNLVVITPEDQDYEELKNIFERDGLGDILDYTFESGNKYNDLEEELNGYFLVRK